MEDRTISVDPASADRSRKRLRMGVVVDCIPPSPSERAVLDDLLQSDDFEVAAIVVSARTLSQRQTPILLELWSKLDRLLFCQSDEPRTSETKIGGIETFSLDPRRFHEGTLSRIRNLGLDVVVQLGPGFSEVELRKCARYGEWSFHYGGHTGDSTEVSFIQDMSRGRDTCELFLKSTSCDFGHRLLYRGRFQSDLFSLCRNLELDHRRKSQVLRGKLMELAERGYHDIGGVYERTESPASKPLDVNAVSGFLFRWCLRAVRRLIARFTSRDQWFVACAKFDCNYQSAQNSKGLTCTHFDILRPPPRYNYADPFVFRRDGKNYIFFEMWRDEEPGVICCSQFECDTLSEPRVVLARDYHLSYPFIFNWRGETYLLPETWDNRTIEVFRAVAFPDKWELAGVLLHNVTAVDATLFMYGGKLWLFAAGLGGIEAVSSELSLFSADSLFGEWRPHPKNPIVCDVRRARPAGNLFFYHGTWVRPAQDCSKSYGYAISLNRVDLLSDTEYREVPFATIQPNWMSGLSGTHTLNITDNLCVLDGRSRLFRWQGRRRRRGDNHSTSTGGFRIPNPGSSIDCEVSA